MSDSQRNCSMSVSQRNWLAHGAAAQGARELDRERQETQEAIDGSSKSSLFMYGT
jgi:hypothetical protein